MSDSQQLRTRWSRAEDDLSRHLRERRMDAVMATLRQIERLRNLDADAFADALDDACAHPTETWHEIVRHHSENMDTLAAWMADVQDEIGLVARAREANEGTRRMVPRTRWLDRSG